VATCAIQFSLVGHLTDQALQDFSAEKYSTGSSARPHYGLTAWNARMQTDRRVISAARQLIILADHTKFHQVGRSAWRRSEAVSVVVTDRETPKDDVEVLRAKGIKVIQADSMNNSHMSDLRLPTTGRSPNWSYLRRRCRALIFR
jgi:DeoR/GlpR family transcriptional regulator of sugar metabolism